MTSRWACSAQNESLSFSSAIPRWIVFCASARGFQSFCVRGVNMLIFAFEYSARKIETRLASTASTGMRDNCANCVS